MSFVESPSRTGISRRELNKAATVEAISEAALGFLRSKALNEFTVDDVAAAAGISRRTFFNYFSSVEAAIAGYTQRYLDTVIKELVARPADEPILESAVHALAAAGNPRDLAIMAETFTLTQDASLARFQLQAWDDCTTKITHVTRERLPEGTSELFLNALVGAVIGACRAAFIVWFTENGNETTSASMDKLKALLTEAVTLVHNGFAL